MPVHVRGDLGVGRLGVDGGQPPQVVAQRVVHDRAEQRRDAVAEVDGVLVLLGSSSARVEAAGADDETRSAPSSMAGAIGNRRRVAPSTYQPAARPGRPPHRREEPRDGGGGHQVVDAEPGRAAYLRWCPAGGSGSSYAGGGLAEQRDPPGADAGGDDGGRLDAALA